MKRILSLGLVVLMIAALLTGCGSASKSTTSMEYASGAVEGPVAMENSLSDSSSSGGETAVLPENHKWIITMNLRAETEDLDALLSALNEKISDLNGFVENQSISNGSRSETYRYRNASLTVRIPAEKVDAFTDAVRENANLTFHDKRLEDVTLQYVATESRITALKTEETRLLELLSQAEDMSDLLAIEQRLTDVRYELENVNSQKRVLDNQIDYATIYLDISQVQEYTPVEKPSVWQRISTGFVKNIKGVGEGLVDLFVWVITCSPYLLITGAVIFLVVRLIRRKIHKKPRPEKPNP